MTWPYKFFPLTASILILGCVEPAKTIPSLEKIHSGMMEEEVISILGKPTSVAQHGNTKYFEYQSYDVDIWYGQRNNIQIFFVRLINDKVESYGRKGDFDSTKNPTKDININQKIDSKNSTTDATQPNKFDLESELRKLDMMKKEGLLNDQEYQQLRQRAIDKAKIQ